MGNIIRRTLILKEVKSSITTTTPLGAIVKIENVSSGGMKVQTKTVNFLPSDDASLAILSADDFIICKPQTEQTVNFSESGSVCAGIFSGGELILFGSSGRNAPKKSDLKEAYDDRLKGTETITENEVVGGVYDDEQIANENYYDNQPISEDSNDACKQDNWNVKTQTSDNRNQKTQFCQEKTVLDETVFESCEEQNGFGTAFYETVREQLKTVFLRGTRETELEKVLPFSRFARVNYSIDKYYVVGLIEDNGKPKYICYGVPGEYLNPPEKLKSYASFVPLSLFNLHGNGYYVMFQSAATGEKINLKTDCFGL